VVEWAVNCEEVLPMRDTNPTLPLPEVLVALRRWPRKFQSRAATAAYTQPRNAALFMYTKATAPRGDCAPPACVLGALRSARWLRAQREAEAEARRVENLTVDVLTIHLGAGPRTRVEELLL
jgi:hypothetical protein